MLDERDESSNWSFESVESISGNLLRQGNHSEMKQDVDGRKRACYISARNRSESLFPSIYLGDS